MTTVRMLTTRPGSPDGVTTHLYKAGQVYDLPDGLARLFLGDKAATEIKKAKGPAENK